MNEENLIKYYNKFNEDKRLYTRHGLVEFLTSMKYIKEALKDKNNPKVIDIGAGCGRYSIELSNIGYEVHAVELVKHNLRVIEKKSDKVKTYLGNATNLSNFNDNSFDLVLLFGPMYHLISEEDKIKALKEAKRIVKKDGIIMCAYCMNDYAIIKHGFIDNYITESIKNKKVDSNYKVISNNDDLYSYVRLEDIDRLNKLAGLKRIKIFTPDGPSDYIRRTLNKMSDEEFKIYLDYHYSTCERIDLIGASSHTVDILKK